MRKYTQPKCMSPGCERGADVRHGDCVWCSRHYLGGNPFEARGVKHAQFKLTTRCACGEPSSTTVDYEPVCWGCRDDMGPPYVGEF